MPCSLGSADINYKTVVVKRVMLGKAALPCASAQLECVEGVGRVEDLLPFRVSLADILSGAST